MDDQTKWLETIDLLYGSILDDKDFDAALKSIVDLTGAAGAAYIEYNAATGDALRCDTVNVDPAAQQSYQGHFSAVDIRVPSSLSLPVGQVFGERTVLSDAAFRSSEVYDFLLRNDIPHIMAVITKKNPHMFSTVSLQRTCKQGAYDRKEGEAMGRVLPHLLRALRIRDLLQSARNSQLAYMEIIHRLPFGVAFLDSSGRLIEVSNAVKQLIRDKQGIGERCGSIFALQPDDDRRLQRAIFESITARQRQAAPGSNVSVRRLPGSQPLSIAVTAVRSPHLFGNLVPSCMLVIFDPETATKPAVEIVRKSLQLTEAESQLACMLFTGVSLRQAATNLGLSINTCKTQLKSIYARTGCRSHVDLAKMLTMTGIASGFGPN